MPYAIGMYYPLVNKNSINSFHEKGIKVFAWTVNNQKKGLQLEKINLDGLITDYPNLFIK